MAQKRGIHDVDQDPITKLEEEVRFGPRRRLESSHELGQKLELPSKSTPPTQVAFQKPYQLVSFSYTPQRELVFNDSALRFWVEPPRNADLNHRYAHWIKRKEERGRLDGLLKAAIHARCDETRSRARTICWRGVLCKILIAPYEERDKWELNVMRLGDTIYLEEHATDQALAQKENMNEHQRKQTYYGYSFESWCTDVRPRGHDQQPRWGGDVDTNVQWCSVVKTKIGQHRLLIGGEVDCVRGRYTEQPDTFVELKTSMTIRPGNGWDEAKFEKKLLKFYFQSFLLGVPEIVVGFRTPQGRLQTVQTFKTLEIPRMVRGKPSEWNPGVCLSWGDNFISQVIEWASKLTCTLERAQVGRISFEPGVGMRFNMLSEAEIEEVRDGEDRIGFLPTWFVEHCLAPPKPSLSDEGRTL